MTGNKFLSLLLLTSTLFISLDAFALAEEQHQVGWIKQNTTNDLPKDWRKRLVVGKPMETPLLKRAELVYQDSDQRVVTLRLAEVLVHVRKQDKHVIAVTNKL